MGKRGLFIGKLCRALAGSYLQPLRIAIDDFVLTAL